MEVIVVSWEYPLSENGEVGGISGVALSPEGARKIAEAEASEQSNTHERIFIDGERWYPAGHPPDEGEEEDLEDDEAADDDDKDERSDDWEVWITSEKFEVEP